MTFKPNPYAIAAIVLAGIAYAPAWQQARSFNSCLSTWEQGYPRDIQLPVKQMLFMRGHSYCSGGAITDAEARAWLQNRTGDQ